jgi:hypothetical protein
MAVGKRRFIEKNWIKSEVHGADWVRTKKYFQVFAFPHRQRIFSGFRKLRGFPAMGAIFYAFDTIGTYHKGTKALN